MKGRPVLGGNMGRLEHMTKSGTTTRGLAKHIVKHHKLPKCDRVQHFVLFLEMLQLGNETG